MTVQTDVAGLVACETLLLRTRRKRLLAHDMLERYGYSLLARDLATTPEPSPCVPSTRRSAVHLGHSRARSLTRFACTGASPGYHLHVLTWRFYAGERVTQW